MILELIAGHHRNDTAADTNIFLSEMPPAAVYLDLQTNYAIHQMFTSCLAHMAYIIVSDGEAAIIDPLRELDPYLKFLKEKGLTLKYIFETHFHADFVSGHYDLSQKTGAQIVFGPTAQSDVDIKVASDNEKFKIGKIHLQVLHTPGHTMESSCYLLLDGEEQKCVFTGDTLFLGEVGRPDLAVKSDEITKEYLAELLFDSLRSKIMKLDPKCIVYPAHGAGSPCGKKISTGTYDVLENQLKTNYALQEMSKAEFVEMATQDLPIPPQYFGHDVSMNKGRAQSVEDVIQRGLIVRDLPSPAEIAELQIEILDTRTAKEFETGYIPGSICLPLTLNYAIWAGTLFNPSSKFFIIASAGKEKESVIRLARIGYDNILGVLRDGVEAYKAKGNTLETLKNINADEVTPEFSIYDVRNPPELDHGHVEGAHNVPLIEIQKRSMDGSIDSAIPRDIPIYIHCKGGARSVMACSILRKLGYTN